jgi:hypothetical protein
MSPPGSVSPYVPFAPEAAGRLGRYLAADTIAATSGRGSSRPASKAVGVATRVVRGWSGRNETPLGSSRTNIVSSSEISASNDRHNLRICGSHLKRILRLDRLRLRGPRGAQDGIPPGRHRPESQEACQSDLDAGPESGLSAIKPAHACFLAASVPSSADFFNTIRHKRSFNAFQVKSAFSQAKLIFEPSPTLSECHHPPDGSSRLIRFSIYVSRFEPG